MVDLQSPKVNGKHRSPLRGFTGQAAEVASDALELLELQVALTREDARDALKGLVRPIALLLLGTCMSLAALPVLLLGIAGSIAYAWDVGVWQAQLGVGVAAVVSGAVTLYLATHMLTRSTNVFRRSTDELRQNLRWLKSIFRDA